jgi:hypothetical protein
MPAPMFTPSQRITSQPLDPLPATRRRHWRFVIDPKAQGEL